MINQLLNFLHRNQYWGLLNLISQCGYFIKGYGLVRARYIASFRAYEYKIKGVVYLSHGPGWAYNFKFLKRALDNTFGYKYEVGTGDCVVDIGAGLGEETVIFAQMTGATGQVHALEANPASFNALKHMCERNNFSWVTPHFLAIYSSDGEITIEDNEENYLVNTVNSSGVSGVRSYTVSARAFDTFVRDNNIKEIDLLKVNIEGAEQFLIQGMKDSLAIIRNICISCHDFRHLLRNDGTFYMTKENVRAFLLMNGFEVEERRTGNAVIDDYIYASNPKLNVRT